MEPQKEVKKEPKLHNDLIKAMEYGIPVKKLIFQQPVINGYGEPESYFCSTDLKLSRRVEMWEAGPKFVFKQNGRIFATPLVNASTIIY